MHGAAIAALLLAASSHPRAMPPTYAVTLVAAPAPSGARKSVVETPPAPPPPAPAPVTRPKTAQPKPAAKTPVKTSAPPKTSSPAEPLPGETPSTGTDIANVNLQGKEFPYPEYLRNLVTQIYRRWNRPVAAALSAEVGFVILRDGTVKEIHIIATSRSYSFDSEALAAVETAAKDKSFGPLPSGYPADYLQIGFMFTPRKAP